MECDQRYAGNTCKLLETDCLRRNWIRLELLWRSFLRMKCLFPRHASGKKRTWDEQKIKGLEFHRQIKIELFRCDFFSHLLMILVMVDKKLDF